MSDLSELLIAFLASALLTLFDLDRTFYVPSATKSKVILYGWWWSFVAANGILANAQSLKELASRAKISINQDAIMKAEEKRTALAWVLSVLQDQIPEVEKRAALADFILSGARNQQLRVYRCSRFQLARELRVNSNLTGCRELSRHDLFRIRIDSRSLDCDRAVRERDLHSVRIDRRYRSRLGVRSTR